MSLRGGKSLLGICLIAMLMGCAGVASRTNAPQGSQTATPIAFNPLSVPVDQYGGRTDIKCTQATGWFHTEKINRHWSLCTPLGNAFYSLSVENAPATIHGTWAAADVNRRMQAWGFNTISLGSNLDDFPFQIDGLFPLDSNGLHTNPVKMPFLASARPAYYAMTNPLFGGSPFLTNPVKNMLLGHSPFYTGYLYPGGVADYYDPGVGTWLQVDLSSSHDFWLALQSSPYLNYAIGFASDDSDELSGFGAGPDFPTNPPGKEGPNLAIEVAAMAPMQTAAVNVAGRGGSSFVYADTLLHTKKAWRDFVAAKYGTIAALNTAWNTSGYYTTFDSSGTCVGTSAITCAASVAADSVGTGNGSTLTFSTTLSHTAVSNFSLQILVAGTPVAGDLGNGNLYGPNVSSGTINYSTGALSITFTGGQAPANGAAITATYVANGWQFGTGLLDEDARAGHSAWISQDFFYMVGVNATMQADLNTFLQQIAGKYFSDCRTQFKAVFPNIMYLGPDALLTYNVPSAAPVLKAAGQYIDAFIGGGTDTVMTQAMLDYVETNWGDKPYFSEFFSTANPDSAMAAYPNGDTLGSFTAQAPRGQAYYNNMAAQLQTAHTTAGNYPYIGVIYFGYYDIPGERLNWGLATVTDNAYDGHEAAAGAVPCSPPIQAYMCGGEPAPGGSAVRPFGSLTGGPNGVTAANLLWLTSSW